MKFPSLVKMSAGIALLLLCYLVPVQAQTKSETLSNKNVVELSKAGLSEDIIITKINASACRFDLSAAALVELKKQGVKDEVVAAMMNKESSASDEPSKPARSGNYSVGTVNSIQAVVHGKPKPLEKQISSIRTKMKAFGYGGASSLLEITGATSPVRLSSGEAGTFLIKTDGSTPDVILYKSKPNGGNRSAETMKATMTGLKPTKSIRSISFNALKNGVYEIKVESSLDKGEYFFTVRQSANPTSPEAYAFGVD